LKKTYPLTSETKKQPRVIESIKNDIRKYIKREKRKTLPEGMNFWNMDCKFGHDDKEPEVIAFQDITKSIDESVELNCKTIYVEILSSAIKREKKVEELVEEDALLENNEEIEKNEDIEQNDTI